MSGVGSSPALATRETSQVTVCQVVFLGVLQFSPHLLIGLFHMSSDVKKKRIIKILNTSCKINDFYSLVNNREANINTVLFSINSKSEGCQEMEAETGVER